MKIFWLRYSKKKKTLKRPNVGLIWGGGGYLQGAFIGCFKVSSILKVCLGLELSNHGLD